MSRVVRGVVLSMLGLLSGCSLFVQPPAQVTALYTGSDYRDRTPGSISGSRYRVQPGDTLYSIAWSSGLDFRNLAAYNHLSTPYIIRVGQSLQLTAPPKSPPKPAAKATTVAATKPKPNRPVSKPVVVAPTRAKNIQVPVASVSEDRYSGSNDQQLANKSKPPVIQKPVTKPITKAAGVISQEQINQALPSKVDRWRWPLEGRVIRRFSTSGTGLAGMDISAAKGTPVRSAAKGRVVYAGQALRGYGKLVIIKHSEDYLSAYAHNSEILVKEHQWIVPGQVIAKVGDTDADSDRLHFQIRLKGKSVNPEQYLPRR